MSYVKGLSTKFTKASGKTVIDFETGHVSVRVDGLPTLEDNSRYEILLVDNKAGPGNSAALDTGPNGDEVISLGLLDDIQGPSGAFKKDLDVDRLRRFEVDMAVVTRVGQNGLREFVIGGLTGLFYKWNRTVGLNGAEPEGFAGLAPSTVVSAAGTESLASIQLSQSIEQGEQLFFNETFNGNGRTCGTCHRADNNLTIDPAFIATLPANDLLFVAEFVPELAQLENPTLMRGPRGLILENIDGFAQPPVFRAAPPMFNLSFTGPYGLSGDFLTIPDFTMGAVAQHFPLTLNRVAGVDFRLPTQAELDDMEAFMLSLFLPPDQDFNLDNFVTTALEQQGRDLFFGSAKCFQCHGGLVLSDASAALGGGNQEFNTGVVNLAINTTVNPGTGPLPAEAGGTREFSTPQLFNVKNTGPFFHDSSVATLQEAVDFYDSVEFNLSPGAAAVGGIGVTPAQVDAIVAFLEALAEPADLAVTKVDSPDPVVSGNNLTYTLTVVNNGPGEAAGVTLTDTLHGSVVFVSATPSQGSCNEAGGTVTCELGPLANGAIATATIVITPPVLGTITNTVSVTSTETDTVTANDAAVVTTTVSTAAAIPGVTALWLVVLAGLMALLLSWRLRRSPLKSR